jgi:hypothetical protein
MNMDMKPSTCAVKDDLVHQLGLLNNKLNTLSPECVHSEKERDEIQQQREGLYIEIKRHRAKGHEGKACPSVQRFGQAREGRL